MELHLSFFPLVFAFFLCLLTFLKHVIKRSKTTGPVAKLPPGPWKLPIIGNLHQLIGALPHHSLRDLAKKHGPIMHLRLGEVSAIVISSPEAAKEVMKTHDLVFANRPEVLAAKIMSYNCTNIAFAPYGDYWRQLRKICMLELLSVRRVQSYRSIREEEANRLIESIYSSPGAPVNLSEKVCSLANSITSRAAFGNHCKDKDEFLMLIKEEVKLAGGFDVPDLFPSLKFLHSISTVKHTLEELHRRMDKILDDIVNEHKKKRASILTSSDNSGRDDLVDVLLKLQESGDLEFPITTNNIKAVISDIFIAGSDTSATTIEWAMSELMRNPRVMEQAKAEVRQVLGGKSVIQETDIQELNYLKLIIKETLRLHPPLPLLLPRETRERCEINGYEIPIKTKVIINAWAIGRDPEHWSDAESFDPERFCVSSIDFKGANFEFIPFGAGRRMCPAVSFGIANVELPLARLLYHFDWTLTDAIKPEDLDMSEAFGATVRRRTGLYLTATPYISLM